MNGDFLDIFFYADILSHSIVIVNIFFIEGYMTNKKHLLIALYMGLCTTFVHGANPDDRDEYLMNKSFYNSFYLSAKRKPGNTLGDDPYYRVNIASGLVSGDPKISSQAFELANLIPPHHPFVRDFSEEIAMAMQNNKNHRHD